MAAGFGIDVGGTFTDLVYYDGNAGRVVAAKVPTVPSSPDEGCLHAIDAALSPDELAACDTFLHGTTVGLNALLERRGATVGLITTRGFRDVLEIRRGDRAEMYNLFWKQDPPLVPRRLRCEVTERTMFDGTIMAPLETTDVAAALDTFKEYDVDSIAVVFLNAYANPAHECLAEAEIRKRGFAGQISMSHQLSREYREYERTSTTVIDAFVKGRMAGYLDRLERGLKGKNFSGMSYIMRSGTGCMRFDEAETRAFETIMSGPVAGAQGAAELTRRCGFGDLITADVGGTSFDTCLILNGEPELRYQGEVIGMPLLTQWVDVRSIGAGGGSIAYIDPGGLLCVGPQSSAAIPGPACYGRGGENATTTDACFYLGMLADGHLASGLVLDRAKAKKALAGLAEKLGKTVHETAVGIVKIASAKMADAIREITVERGLDPRAMKLLAFGGAGPMLATNIALELDIDEVIVPPFAGNFSAWGLLGADIVKSASLTFIDELTEAMLDKASQATRELFADLEKTSRLTGLQKESTTSGLSIDLRYLGQEHTLNLAVRFENGQIAERAVDIARRYRAKYKTVFDSELEEPIQIVTLRTELRTKQSLLENAGSAAGDDDEALVRDESHLDSYSFTADAVVPFRFMERAALRPDVIYPGPMLIREETTMFYVDAGFNAHLAAGGNVFARRGG